MDCSNCGTANREGAKFCAGCARPIVASCSSCRHDLAAGAKFCDQCGTPVAATGHQDAVSGAAVRKTVTVLFCDLVGSTTLGERVDAESARDVMGRYHAMAQQVIEAHGGTVAKFIGDGVMAIFGVPEVAADDAERAVATGLELQRGFLPLGELINDRYGVEVGLRVGINTGEVVIADADADVIGDVLNTAARLEGACLPGQVLVGEDTWRLTRSAIAYEAFGDLELRGKAGMVATFRAIDEIVAIDDSTTPFVGRAAELSSLQRVFDDAVAERSVRLATVIGAPGVGKTRLSREFRRAIVEDATIVELRCERAGAATFTPIADLLRFVSDVDESMSPDDAISKLHELVNDLDDSERVSTLLGSFLGAAPMRSTEEQFFAVRRLVEALGRRRPFVIIVDDVQWAEPMFLDLLEHLAEWAQDAAAMVLGLARPELREIRPTLAEQGRRVAESISLEGLDAEATAELAAQLVGADSLPDDLVARLPESTEGNPLFVRELMKMLVDDGVITENDGTWELTIDADAVEVPPTIQSLLSTRIERMPADERRLVELASVVGPEFPLGAVAAIGSSGDSGAMMPTLERLRRKELVEPTGTYWGNEPLFRFHHVLIRDAAYRRLLKGARAELHLKVAAWTTETAADLVGEHEVTIGYHFEQAHEYRRQLNIADDDTIAIGRRAAELLHTAAVRALASDDVAAAGSLAIRAVERLETDAEELPELLMLGCEALLALGDVANARYLLKQLTDLAVGDVRLTAWAACYDSQLATLTEPDRLHKADDDAAAAAEQLRELGDDAGEAKARLVRAGALARLGHIGQCEAELDLALTAARAGNDSRRVAAVLGAAPVAALWGPSPVSRAGGRCLDVVRLLRITTGSPSVAAISTRCQAVLEALRGRFDTARTMLNESRATLEELGLRHGLLETELYSGIVELLAGDPVAAEPHLRAAYGGLGRLGIGADAGQAAAHLSRALLLQGRLEEADELAADSDALAGQNPQTAIVARTAQAEILAARGLLVEARRVAEAAVELGAGTDIVIDHANANVALARVRRAAGDAVGARQARDAAAALFEAKGATVDLSDLMDVETPPVAPTRDQQPEAAGVRVEEFPSPSDQPEPSVGVVEAIAQLAVTPSGEPPPDLVRFCVESWDEFARAGSSGNDESRAAEMLAFMDERLEMIDHRQIGWPVVDRDGFGQRLRSVLELDGEMAITVPHVHRIDGVLSLVEMVNRIVRTNGSEHVDRSLIICTISAESGLTVTNEQFAGHELQAATARYDELLREHSAADDLWNTATMVVNRAHSWAKAGQHELLDTLFGNHVGRVGFGVEHCRVLAVRGERLTLMDWRNEGGPEGPFHRFAVVEIDAAIRISRVSLFDADEASLMRAADQLDERFLATHDVPAAGRTLLDGIRSWRHHDVAMMERAFEDDVQIVDGKVLGWPVFDKGAWIDLVTGGDQVQDAVVPSRILTMDDAGIAVQLSIHHVTADGDLTERIPGIYIATVRDSRISYVEAFDDDRAAAALARLAELTGNIDDVARNADESADTDDDAWNSADRQLRHFLRLLVTRDLDGYRSILSENIVIDDRRPFVQEVFEGRERAMDAMAPGIYPADSDLVADVAIIACRGDHFALHRCGVREASEADGPMLEWLGVVKWSDGGLLSRAVLFDPAEYWAAVAELDRMCLEDLEDPSLGHSIRTWSAVYNQLGGAQVDVDEFLGYADRSLRFVDHRQLGWPEDDFDGLRDRILSLTELGGDRFVCVARVHRAEHTLVLAETRTIASTPDGAIYDDRYLHLNVADPGTGLIVEQHQFAPEQLGDALAMFARTHETQPEEDGWSNTASVLGRMATRRQTRQMLVTFADDFVIADQRGTALVDDVSELLDAAVAERLGFVVEHRDVLAIRGERLALVHLHGEAEGKPYRRFVVEEITASGQVSRITHYDVDHDSLVAAADRIDERWLTIEPAEFPDVALVFTRFTSARRASDHEATLEILADDFVFTDNRPLGSADMDRASWIETNAAVGDARGVAVIGEVIRMTEFGFVGTSALCNVSDDGAMDEAGMSVGQEAIVMASVRDGRLVRLEFFPDDQPEQALARLDELAEEATGADATRGHHVPWNTADAHARRFTATQLSRDDNAFVRLFADDVVLDDRRRHVQDRYVGRDAVLEAIGPGSFPSDQVFVADIETVATRRDDLVLVLNTFREEGRADGPMSEMLAISSWTRSGEMDLAMLFDPDDYVAAAAELDRLYLDGLDESVAVWIQTAAYGRISARDIDGVVAFMDPGFTMTDHSTIGWPTLGIEGYRERIGSLMDVDADLASFAVRYHRQDGAGGAGDAISLFEGLHRVAHRNGVVQIDRHFCVASLSAESGLATRVDFFQADQFDAALAFYDEKSAERPALQAPSNVASICGNRLNSFVRLERWNVVDSAFAEEVVIEDASGSRLIGDRSELLDPGVARSIGLGVATRRVMAVRGQRLVLVELRDVASEGKKFHRFVVEEVDGNQRICRLTHFEPDALADAVTHLDRRFLEVYGTPVPESLRNGMQFTHDRNRFDSDAVALLLRDDFELVDNRPLGFPTSDRTSTLEVIRTARAAPTVLVVPEFLVITDAGYVCTTIQWTVHADAESFESVVATVAVVSGANQLARMEFFPEAEREVAMARFEELTDTSA